MKRYVAMICIGTTALAVPVCAGTSSQRVESTHADVSPFGSWAAQEGLFDAAHSDFRPSRVLTEPGTLKGRWLAPDQESDLLIQPDPQREEVDGDYFVMHAGTVTSSFESSYGAFAVFGCDIDGDRVDEVVIEDGRGRGTFVYQRRLTILKLFDGRWRSVFTDWLSGYLLNDQAGDPLVWQRRYSFCNLSPNRLDIVLTLVPPARVPRSRNAPEDYAPLQHPRSVMRYHPELKAFRTWEESSIHPPTSEARPEGDRVPVPGPKRQP